MRSYCGKVGSSTASEFEQHCLAGRQVHDGFHVVVDALDEARRTLGVLVRVFGLPYRVRFRIPMPVTFRPGYSIVMVKSNIEPDR